MGRPAERWPTYALENLEKTLYELKQLERVLDSAQDAILLCPTCDGAGMIKTKDGIRKCPACSGTGNAK